jgi:hypothetical protein
MRKPRLLKRCASILVAFIHVTGMLALIIFIITLNKLAFGVFLSLKFSRCIVVLTGKAAICYRRTYTLPLVVSGMDHRMHSMLIWEKHS